MNNRGIKAMTVYDGSVCPYCGSQNTEWKNEEWQDGLLYEDRKCCDCGETYTVVYDLVAVGLLDRHNNPID